uniref:DUF551 domain-containing protein n=1 Tax=Klebsiella phage FKP3 TaxID=3231233 RepID=A0AAU8HZB6_9CAUD
MAESMAREELYKEMLLNIAHDLGLYDPDFTEVVNKIYSLQHPWIDVDGIHNMPFGNWVVIMADGEYGICQVVQGGSGKFAVINGRFYFDWEPVVAYMPMPQYIPKGGA